MRSTITIIAGLAFAGAAHAHVVGWAKGMYCLGGNDTSNPDNPNANAPVNPLWDLEQEDWWFQHSPTGCDQFPPVDGDFLELPAGGSFTVELAHNRGQTTLGPGPVTDWPDGGDGTSMTTFNDEGCVLDGAMHTKGEAGAYGTAFAISYESDLSAVTMENLAVFTTLEHTPWKRLATYDVPADLPACPEDGCHCAFLWVPNGCGEPNMYMAGYKCKVTGSTSTKTVAPAQVPVYCADDSSKCVSGAKQMIAWNQASGNNVPSDVQPGYNSVMGWATGAQNDIFQ